jgi:HTH-type transcriptional regulator/antitoxin HigA
MTAQPLPAIIVTPGEVLKAELEARGLNQRDLALILGRPEQMISEVINAKKQITPDTAVALEQALAVSAQFWLSLEANYQLYLAEQRARDEAIARRAQLFARLPLRKMARRGWLDLPKDPGDLERRVGAYLGFDPLGQTPALSASWRHATVREPDPLLTAAWLRRVEYLASRRRAQGAPFSDLGASIPALLAHAACAEDVARVPETLAALGVTLVIVPHLDHTYLDGAAFTTGDRRVVALTLRYDRVDAFWFTLLHELAHLLEGGQPSYLDALPLNGDRGAIPPTPDPEEGVANQRARDWLIPPGALADFVAEAAPRFAQEDIEAFARAIERHPGIVLGRLMRDGCVRHSYLRGLLVKVGPYLAGGMDG